MKPAAGAARSCAWWTSPTWSTAPGWGIGGGDQAGVVRMSTMKIAPPALRTLRSSSKSIAQRVAESPRVISLGWWRALALIAS